METCGRHSRWKLRRRQDHYQEVLFRAYKKWRPPGAYDGLLVLWVTNSINFLSPNNIKSQFREKVTRILTSSATQNTCQPFSESEEIFVLEFPKTSQRLPRISDDFPKTYERFRKSPRMFRRTLSTSEAIWKATNLACFERITTQSQHYAPLWNIFVEIAGIEFPLLIMC